MTEKKHIIIQNKEYEEQVKKATSGNSLNATREKKSLEGSFKEVKKEQKEKKGTKGEIRYLP
ncbi:MAG: hypothetical protein IH823_06755 [Candidatus Dadabacteria bacterium]|nr:hypothetical protein [Candidatus Dadabacteria bacterium]